MIYSLKTLRKQTPIKISWRLCLFYFKIKCTLYQNIYQRAKGLGHLNFACLSIIINILHWYWRKKIFEAVQEFKLMRCSHSRWGMAPWRGWGGGGWKSHLIANKSQNLLKNCCFSFTFQTYRSSDSGRDRQSQQLKLPRPRDCSMDGLGQLCFLETCEASMHLSMGWDGYR